MILKCILLFASVYIIYDIACEILYLSTTYFKVTKTPRFRMRADKGKYGEYQVWKKIKDIEKDGGKFLFNLYLPKERGGTTEIDVLLLSPQGIFVFESKNYSGWIFGNEKTRYWTQTLPAGRRKSHKEHFLNPIMQNDLHVRCLKKVIGTSIPLCSIIVFSDHCELKQLQVNMAGSIQVVKLDSLPNIVYGLDWGSPIATAIIGELYDRLYPYTQVSNAVKQEHVAEIRSRLQQAASEPDAKPEPDRKVISLVPEPMQDEKQPIQIQPAVVDTKVTPTPKTAGTLICPRCGGTLVLRTAKRGSNVGNQFYGCSNYPKCRYIQNIE